MPRIGSGLAGGKWEEVERIVEEELTANDDRHWRYPQFELPNAGIAPGALRMSRTEDEIGVGW
jgi:hypothetical protein